MPIANVDLTNSLEYFRMITNQCIVAWNGMTNDNTSFARITINPPSPVSGLVSLNVANGLLSGNGAGIFSYPNTGIVGVFTNDQLQNANISFISAVGVNVGTNVASLNTGTITITSAVVDSLSNTGKYFPAAANAIPRLLSAIGTYTKTLGRFAVNVGGTGRVGTSYTNGQILLSNTAGVLEPNTIPNSTGIIVTNRAGSIQLDANIVAINATISWSETSGITISQNTYPNASATIPGVMRITDSTANQSTITAASANSLNAVARVVASASSLGAVNAHGRLVSATTYEINSFLAGNTVWTPSNTAQIAFVVVTVCAGGGRGGGANSDNSTSNYAVGAAGGAGSTLKGIITAAQLLGFKDENGVGSLTLRYSARAAGSSGGTSPGEPGTRGSNVQIGANGTGYIFFCEGGVPSPTIKLLTNVGLSANVITSGPARSYANTTAGTILQSSSGRPGIPGMVLHRGATGGGAPAHVAAITGKPFIAQWERSGWPGDLNDQQIYTSNGSTKITDGSLFFGKEECYGMGGHGALSANASASGTGATGAEAGSGFILIEMYTNA